MNTTVQIPISPLTAAAVAAPARAAKVFTMGAAPTANDTITVGTHVYKLAVAPTASGDVLFSATPATALANLAYAINTGNSLNVAQTLVTAVAGASTLTVTAITEGVAGNTIAIASNMTSGSNLWASSATALSGGVDSTQTLGAILWAEQPIGTLSLIFKNLVQPGKRYGVETGHAVTLEVVESPDGKVWTLITPVTNGGVALASGGEVALTIRTHKRYIGIRGSSAVGGGYVRLDIMQRGLPFNGQVDVGMFGKRDLSKDYVGNYASPAFLAEPAKPKWPEA